MSYRTALQALTAHENPHLMPPHLQQQLDTLEETRHMLGKKQEQLQQRVKKLQEDAGRQSVAGQQQQQGGRQDAGKAAAEELAAVGQKLQAVTEACRPLQQQHQQWEAVRQVLLDDLVDSKYHLVVSSQNFGVFASRESASNMKAGWLVHSIHTLRERHPTLKVSWSLLQPHRHLAAVWHMYALSYTHTGISLGAFCKLWQHLFPSAVVDNPLDVCGSHSGRDYKAYTDPTKWQGSTISAQHKLCLTLEGCQPDSDWRL
jgi:hypothetical protein